MSQRRQNCSVLASAPNHRTSRIRPSGTATAESLLAAVAYAFAAERDLRPRYECLANAAATLEMNAVVEASTEHLAAEAAAAGATGGGE